MGRGSARVHVVASGSEPLGAAGGDWLACRSVLWCESWLSGEQGCPCEWLLSVPVCTPRVSGKACV